MTEMFIMFLAVHIPLFFLIFEGKCKEECMSDNTCTGITFKPFMWGGGSCHSTDYSSDINDVITDEEEATTWVKSSKFKL